MQRDPRRQVPVDQRDLDQLAHPEAQLRAGHGPVEGPPAAVPPGGQRDGLVRGAARAGQRGHVDLARGQPGVPGVRRSRDPVGPVGHRDDQPGRGHGDQPAAGDPDRAAPAGRRRRARTAGAQQRDAHHQHGRVDQAGAEHRRPGGRRDQEQVPGQQLGDQRQPHREHAGRPRAVLPGGGPAQRRHRHRGDHRQQRQRNAERDLLQREVRPVRGEREQHPDLRRHRHQRADHQQQRDRGGGPGPLDPAPLQQRGHGQRAGPDDEQETVQERPQRIHTKRLVPRPGRRIGDRPRTDPGVTRNPGCPIGQLRMPLRPSQTQLDSVSVTIA